VICRDTEFLVSGGNRVFLVITDLNGESRVLEALSSDCTCKNDISSVFSG